MEIKNLIKRGARVEVTFYCQTLEEAREKLNPYMHYGNVEKGNRNKANWINIECEDEDIEFVAFYEEVK